MLPLLQFGVRYEVKQRKLCNTHTVYNTERPIYSFNWVWYYGANVPAEVRVRVDRAITTLRLKGQMRHLIAHPGETSDDLDCGTPSQSIGVEIVGPMIVVVVGIFVLVLCGALVRKWRILQREKTINKRANIVTEV